MFYLTFVITRLEEFWRKSPSLGSRTPTIIALHVLKRYILNNLSLFKDPNPNAVNIVRDIPNIFNVADNVRKKQLFGVDDQRVLQDFTHWGGQVGRFICRATFQAPTIFFNYSNAASVSKTSNLVCEVVSISATEISRKSQLEGKILYYTSLPDLKYYKGLQSKNIQGLPKAYKPYKGLQYIKENTGITYFLDNFATACFRAAILYGIGEFGATPLKKLFIEKPIHLLEKMAERGINYIANTPEDFINLQDDPYTAYNKITTKTNHSIFGYFSFALLEIQHLGYFYVIEAIIGTFMLSSSRVITPKLMTTLKDLSTSLIIAIDVGLISFVYNQDKLMKNIPSLNNIKFLFDSTIEKLGSSINKAQNFLEEQINSTIYETIEATILGDIMAAPSHEKFIDL